eukprot:TRINITY_DN3637_c0_g1_i2.p1 TRINITY_DN3637_c0_g1~~TRINITY_DN3637_c0_g1_i2.p1  ORF type:complete len:138 (+),score=12.65 TRINITY_DN3637_c0_g1_i2:191-604(+)
MFIIENNNNSTTKWSNKDWMIGFMCTIPVFLSLQFFFFSFFRMQIREKKMPSCHLQQQFSDEQRPVLKCPTRPPDAYTLTESIPCLYVQRKPCRVENNPKTCAREKPATFLETREEKKPMITTMVPSKNSNINSCCD